MVSEDDAIDFKSIVGKPVTVTLTLGNDVEHHLNGIVGRFVQEETNLRLTRYFADADESNRQAQLASTFPPSHRESRISRKSSRKPSNSNAWVNQPFFSSTKSITSIKHSRITFCPTSSAAR